MGVGEGDKGRFQKGKPTPKTTFLKIFFKVSFNQLLKQRQKLKTFHVNKQQRTPNA